MQQWMPKRSVNPNCVPKPQPDADCEKSVYDVLVPQQFQDSITTAQPIQRSVPKEAIKKDWLELRTVPQDDHEHLVGKSQYSPCFAQVAPGVSYPTKTRPRGGRPMCGFLLSMVSVQKTYVGKDDVIQ
jgi:hypothetical protein